MHLLGLHRIKDVKVTKNGTRNILDDGCVYYLTELTVRMQGGEGFDLDLYGETEESVKIRIDDPPTTK